MSARASAKRWRLAQGLALGLAIWLALTAAATPAMADTHTVALVSLQHDARHTPRQLALRYPGHPAGPLWHAVQMGVADAQVGLRSAHITLKARPVALASADDLGPALARLHADKVVHWVLDLPADLLAQAMQHAQGRALVFNASASADPLRRSHCAAHLFHTYPSHSMHSDALAQYLAARRWTQVLLLHGTQPDDLLMRQAWQRSAQRFGLHTVATQAFVRSGNPRERDMAHPRLLTQGGAHDVVAVVDADGEFARALPYATQHPRPVVGANGLVAHAWHAQWERHGGPQVNRRFARQAQRPMVGQDWAAWVATKTVAALLRRHSRATVAQQAALLRSGAVSIDGAKGPALSYRAWDGQLRQPMLLAHADGVVASAPQDGVLHPSQALDTLGHDEKESPCPTQPHSP